jgi:hypothetical protein
MYENFYRKTFMQIIIFMKNTGITYKENLLNNRINNFPKSIIFITNMGKAKKKNLNFNIFEISMVEQTPKFSKSHITRAYMIVCRKQ